MFESKWFPQFSCRFEERTEKEVRLRDISAMRYDDTPEAPNLVPRISERNRGIAYAIYRKIAATAAVSTLQCSLYDPVDPALSSRTSWEPHD